MTRTLTNGKRIRLIEGDITRVPADAIVNAANASLSGGGGVDGAIHRAGGPEIMSDLDEIRPRIGGRCPTGSAVATTAGRLPARFVFHAVGPVYWRDAARAPELLASCYTTALRMAGERSLTTIAFPSISTGAYGYPLHEAAPVALRAVADFLAHEASTVEEAIFVLWGREAYEAYESALEALTIK
ncbi:MAG: O-acetyl-ADP-ribose deacetylase [bacterium]|jgi:O-acetyl-ADP-ribose deacetylase (regulator of RNase III)